MRTPDMYDVRDLAGMATIAVAILFGGSTPVWGIAVMCAPFALLFVACHAYIRANGGKG